MLQDLYPKITIFANKKYLTLSNHFKFLSQYFEGVTVCTKRDYFKNFDIRFRRAAVLQEKLLPAFDIKSAIF